MRQVFQDPRARGVQMADLPRPALMPGSVLVRNAFSVISPGTERNAVRAARDSLLTTARARPDLVRRVLETVRREGVLAAYRKIESKRSELRPLGYSSAGTVIGLGLGAEAHFRIGDRVACAGAGYANHAEVVSVPTNLAARVPDAVPLEAAAFATLGAIALQGTRQAGAGLGDRFAVIGLGLMGLLTVQLLRAAGARVIGFDLSSDLARRAMDLGAELASAGTTDDQVAMALSWTDGIGVDGVIVTATAKDDGPMVAAAGMCRDRGRVTVVGLVPFGLPREIAYEKELELRIARSYGPGRYDARYEEHGQDYPIGYVRWTETRNLESFLQLMAEGKARPLVLVTHRFGIESAIQAYEVLLGEAGPRPLGVLLSYPTGAAAPVEGQSTDQVLAQTFVGERPRHVLPALGNDGEVRVGFIGAGAFARSTLLPLLGKMPRVSLRSVVTAHGLTALDVQRRFGFRQIGTDPDDILRDPEIHLVVVATRHDSHAELAARALRSGKHVFVEKPLALNERDLTMVEAAASAAPGMLMVGFNRRFSSHARALRSAFAEAGPLLMTYRVNAGSLARDHWVNDPLVGGGRILGECCHFIDLMSFLTGDREVVSLSQVVPRGGQVSEEVLATLEFADGSAGQLLYSVRGASRDCKETLTLQAGGLSATLEDFHKCTVYGRISARRIRGRSRGHLEELVALMQAVREGGPAPISLPVLTSVARTTLQLTRAVGGQRDDRRTGREQ